MIAVADQALLQALQGAPGAAQRRALAKAITLLESTRVDHRARADALLDALLPRSGHAFRLGISGVPFFIFDGRYGLGGAQPPEVLLDALRRSLLPPTP